MITINKENCLVIRDDGKVMKVVTKHNGDIPQIHLTTPGGMDDYEKIFKGEGPLKIEKDKDDLSEEEQTLTNF